MADVQLDPSRAVGRLSAEFVLAFLKSLSDVSDGDFLDGVIRMAVLDANVRHLISDPDASRLYASFELAVPDALRRPVSINAISASLGMPFETTRRRIRNLHDRGMCKLSDAGVILPEVQLQTEEIRAFTVQNYANLAAFYRGLHELAPEAALAAVEAAPPVATPSDEPVRLAMRSTVGYALRYIEAAEPVAGDLISAILFLAVQVANVEHVTHSPGLSHQYETPQAVVPDDQRRRVTVQTLSKSLGMSFETTRRRVNALVERGSFARDGQGVYVPSAILLSDTFANIRRANAGNLHRLFSGLARLGVRFD